MSDPQFDLLAHIQEKERLPGGSFAVLSDSQSERLDALLAQYAASGATATLQRAARTFLIAYRELDRHAGILDESERRQLADALDDRRSDEARGARRHRPVPARTLALPAAVALLVIGAGLGARVIVASNQSGPPAGNSRQVQQQAPPGVTDLQALKQDWGPWRQIAPSGQRPQTGSPALLLLEDGGYYASKWTIPARAPWQPDLGGSIGAIDVHGSWADITDSDANPYVVGTGQPFIISSSPGTVLEVDGTGNVLSLPLARAVIARQPVK